MPSQWASGFQHIGFTGAPSDRSSLLKNKHSFAKQLEMSPQAVVTATEVIQRVCHLCSFHHLHTKAGYLPLPPAQLGGPVTLILNKTHGGCDICLVRSQSLSDLPCSFTSNHAENPVKTPKPRKTAHLLQGRSWTLSNFRGIGPPHS